MPRKLILRKRPGFQIVKPGFQSVKPGLQSPIPGFQKAKPGLSLRVYIPFLDFAGRTPHLNPRNLVFKLRNLASNI